MSSQFPQVRDAFYSSKLLPRLINPEAVKRAIADRVSQGIIGYAIKDASGQLKLEKPKDGLFDADVEISEDVFILRTDDAQKLREPPRLNLVVIRPEGETVRIGEQIAFSCSGLDQYGQPIAVGDVQWSATGGTIDSHGMFTGGDHRGAFTVNAVTSGGEALAEVRITSKDDPLPPPSPPGAAYIRWRGCVPPQKWMNFYTKVLSKHATSPDLKIEVRFEGKVDREQADSKAGETKAGLRELGLDDGVSLT
jgi:hypothetical protein